MSNKISYLKAKRRITEVFLQGMDPIAAGSSVSDDEMEDLLDSLAPSLTRVSSSQMPSISMFMYEGCRRFDRWHPPTPYVASIRQNERFSKFVRAFWRAEQGSPTNCAVFQVHLTRNLVFSRFEDAPFTTVKTSEVDEFRQQISRIPTPVPLAKQVEFEKAKSDLMAILDGLIVQDLRTVLKFRVPYILHKQKLELTFAWQGISMHASVTPSFQQSDEGFINVGNGVSLSLGASRWQTGTSTITLEQAVLMDGSSYTERLQTLPGQQLAIEGWPKSFTRAFAVFHDLVWRLRSEYEGHQDWIPAPRDLSDLEYWLKTNDRDNFNWVRKGSPAELVQAFIPNAAQLRIDLGELSRLKWSAECRLRANMYLELGDTNESLFWLNVAVESLISQRFSEIETLISRPGLADELGSPKEFWAEAEAILTKQHPEMTGKVKWPNAQIHVSIYGKLKTLYRLVPMKTSIKELEHHYRKVSGERNDLFHGKNTARTAVATVEAAAASLDWIDANMWPIAK